MVEEQHPDQIGELQNQEEVKVQPNGIANMSYDQHGNTFDLTVRESNGLEEDYNDAN